MSENNTINVCGYIGRGVSSIVYRDDNGKVIKIIQDSYFDELKRGGYNPERYIKNEVMVLKEMSGKEYFPIYYEDYISEGNIHIVMSEAPGTELIEICVDHILDDHKIKTIFINLIRAIQSLHTNHIAHRDIKLENIMYDIDEDKLTLIDFGLSVKTKDFIFPKLKWILPIKKVIYYQDACGSIDYVAPEILSKKPYNAQISDIWSAGVCLYAIICGSLPFSGDTRADIIKNILLGQFEDNINLNSDATNLLNGILCKNPSERLSLEQILNHPYLNI